MALRLWLLRMYIPIQLEALWMLIWIASVANGSTFIKNQPKNKDSTLVPDGQITDFNIVNSSLFTKPLARPVDYVIPESKKIGFDEVEDEFDDDKIIDSRAKQKHDNTSIPNNRDTFILNPDVLFHQEQQNLDDENSKRNNFKSREQKHISGYHFLMSNGTVVGSKIESKDPFHFILNNVTSLNRTQHDGQSELVNGSVNVLDVKKPLQDTLNKSVNDDKSIKTNLSDTALFNKYLIAERKKAASNYNSTLSLSKQKIIYHESTFNESSLMNDQPVQSNISDGTIKSTNDKDDEEDNLELSDHDNITNIDEATNETIYNGSSSAIGRIMPASTGISFNTIVITSISLGVVILGGIMAAGSYVIYRHRYWNKPQTLSDKCSNADSSGYIDDSTLRENSEEMYSLDNDSFLNSLEAMTIQNYWTDNVKHTKL